MTGMPNAAPAVRLSGAGPWAVSSRSVPPATASATPSASPSAYARVIAWASSREAAAAQSRISFCGSPGTVRKSRPHPPMSAAKDGWAATAT